MTCLGIVNDLYHTKINRIWKYVFMKDRIGFTLLSTIGSQSGAQPSEALDQNNPELSEALDDCKVGKFAKYYSRHQVELIVDYLDEP